MDMLSDDMDLFPRNMDMLSDDMDHIPRNMDMMKQNGSGSYNAVG